MISDVDVFSTDDLHELSAQVAAAWRAGAERDWSVAGSSTEGDAGVTPA